MVDLARGVAKDLKADPEVVADPAKYYDRVVEIDLSTLEPHINGPFSPDAAMPISTVAAKAKEKGFPQKLEVALIGSCTNSSYEDITRAASVAKEMIDKGIEVKTPIMVVPGSVRIFQTLERDGLLDVFRKLNAPVGGLVKGIITNITDFGLFVEVEEGIEGLVHVSELSNKSNRRQLFFTFGKSTK